MIWFCNEEITIFGFVFVIILTEKSNNKTLNPKPLSNQAHLVDRAIGQWRKNGNGVRLFSSCHQLKK